MLMKTPVSSAASLTYPSKPIVFIVKRADITKVDLDLNDASS
jgi:hypothetical protein